MCGRARARVCVRVCVCVCVCVHARARPCVIKRVLAFVLGLFICLSQRLETGLECCRGAAAAVSYGWG